MSDLFEALIEQAAVKMYVADYSGIPNAGEKWVEGRAQSWEYDRYRELARAAFSVLDGPVIMQGFDDASFNATKERLVFYGPWQPYERNK